MHPQLGSMGYLSCALARALGGWISLATIIVVVRQKELQAFVWRLHPQSEPLLKPGAMREYLRVSLPSAVVVWSEWWALEVLALLVGLTPDAKLNLAAHGTMLNIIVVFYMLDFFHTLALSIGAVNLIFLLGFHVGIFSTHLLHDPS